MGTVICKVPKAGLGNQLFPILRAYCFANLNQLPVLVYNYHQLKPGPWFRGEKNKRQYRGFFNFEKNIVAALIDGKQANKLITTNTIKEPAIVKQPVSSDINYYFGDVPYYENHFDGLREHRELVKELLYKIINPKIIKEVKALERPCISVHARLGDFKVQDADKKFGSEGTTRTSETYFIEVIEAIRKMKGEILPVKVFTDGRKEELSELFKLENISIVDGNNDLVDLLLLSRSKIIVMSAGSTFSYWGGFISDAILIAHPAYENLKIRSKIIDPKIYEGAFHHNNSNLQNQLNAITP